MKLDELKEGMPVVYIPEHLLWMAVKDNQLGIVSSTNDTYAFIRYKDMEHAQATKPIDLYPLHNRPDLMERLGLEVKPINRICELWIEQRELFSENNSTL